MKLKIGDDILIILVYILSFIMLMGELVGIKFITSGAFALSFVVVLVIWGLHINKIYLLDLLTIAISAFSLICVVITCESFTISYFYKWLMFSAVFFYFSTCMKIKISEKTTKALFFINFLLSISCILVYVIKFDSIFYITNVGERYLTFDFYNPNSLALFLVCIAMTGVLYCFIYRVGFLKKMCYIGMFIFLILQTLSRTSLLAIVFFLAISVIFVRKKHYYLPENKIVHWIIATFPIVFALIYMKIIGKINQKGYLSLITSEGKGLDSREFVWNYAIDLFEKSPVVGSYGYITTASEFSQMHNSHIDVLASYGIIVFILVIYFLFIILKKIVQRSKGTSRSLSVWAFIVCLMLGVGEAVLFSGGLSFYLMVGQFLLFCNSCQESVKCNEK